MAEPAKTPAQKASKRKNPLSPAPKPDAPAKANKKSRRGGRSKGQQNITTQDKKRALQAIRAKMPFGQIQWDDAAEMYNKMARKCVLSGMEPG